MAYVNIDVDLSDIYSDLSDYEKRELADYLIEDGVVSSLAPDPSASSYNEEEFADKCNALSKAYYRMSNEETKLIEALAAKYWV